MPLALITGGTRGLGHATARSLARAGHTVIITGRDADGVESAVARAARDGLSLEGLVLDVTDVTSVTAAADHVGTVHGRLDVLVNNAGIRPEARVTGSWEFASTDAVRATFETNVLGVVSMVEAFLPLLRRSPAGRIVNVSSTLGSLHAQSDPDSPWYEMVVPGYQASKTALNSLTLALAKRLADTPIVVTAVSPGWVQTDLAPGYHQNAPLTAEEAAVVVVAAARAPVGAVSGTFVDANGPVRW